ncbi:MAG: hypothetical protein HDS11_03835 [Bacteroides sp.]|nr:hypothetical protein [Bacteroides sp.]
MNNLRLNRFLILTVALLASLAAQARSVTFFLTAGSAAELRQVDYTTGQSVVIAELNAGIKVLDLKDDYYTVAPATNRVIDYVRDVNEQDLPVATNGTVRLTISAQSGDFFTIATLRAPNIVPTTVYVYPDSWAQLKHYNTLTQQYEHQATIYPGTANFDLVENDSYILCAGAEHVIKECVDSRGNDIPLTQTEFGMAVSFVATPETVSSVYNITTEGPTPPDPNLKVFYVDIDNPDMVNASISPSYTPIELKPGRNVCYFDVNKDMGLWVRTKNDRDFYSVKHNGFAVDFDYYALVYLSEGSEVEVRYEFPEDLTHTYNLQFLDQSAGFWTKVTVDGEEYTPVNNRITARAGALIELWNSDALSWNITQIDLPSGRSIHGYPGTPYEMDPSKPISFYATYRDGPVKVSAHRYADVNVTFNVTGNDLVNVVAGTFNTQTHLELKEGANALHDSESRFQYVKITSRTAGEGFVSSVTYKTTAGGDMMTAEYDFDRQQYIIQNLLEGAVVNITAVAKPATYPLPVTINNLTDVALYTDASLSEASRLTIAYTTGGYTVNYPENKCTLYVAPANDNCFVRSVTYKADADSDPYNATQSGSMFYLSKISRRGSVNIVAGHYEDMIHQCVVYADRNGATLYSADLRPITLEAGYNVVPFNEVENRNTSFTLTGMAGANFTAYKNNSKLSAKADDAHSADVRLKDGDIIKVYMTNPTPALYNVKFTGLKPAEGRVDLFTELTEANFADGIHALPGTEVTFLPAQADVTVTVNGTEVTSDPETGYYTVSIPERNCEINIADSNSGISTITADDSAEAEYYDLQGRRITNPSAGIYVKVAGGVAEKVIVK